MSNRGWHKETVRKIKEIGEKLGFKVVVEAPLGKRRIDCLWVIKRPVLNCFVAFEVENKKEPNLLNIAKILTIPTHLRPRFLFQIYKYRLGKKAKASLEDFKKNIETLATVETIDNVGENIDEAIFKSLWFINSYSFPYNNLSEELIDKIREVFSSITKFKVYKVLHYGEPSISHLQYLDNVLRSMESYLMWIHSVPKAKNKSLRQRGIEVSKYDIVILSDVKLEQSDIEVVNDFLLNNVKKGKSLIITGGIGFSTGYNRLSNHLGYKILKSLWKKSELTWKVNLSIGSMIFKGYNKVKVVDSNVEVLAQWNTEDPAVLYKKFGNGKILIFTSDCSPDWGVLAVKTAEFYKMWKSILEYYII